MLYLQERPYSLPAPAGLRPRLGYSFPIAASAPARARILAMPRRRCRRWRWAIGVLSIASDRRGLQRAHRYTSR